MTGPIIFPRYAIVVVPFPYSDQLAEKRRPALVISHGDLAQEQELVWVTMITSATNPRWQIDIAIEDHLECGLPAPSFIRPAKLATMDAARILRVLGTLRPAECDRVSDYYRKCFR